MPGVESRLTQFREANTQVLGVSVDSVYSHTNWGRDIGGISFPLLADFHPKGATAKAYGLYLEDMGITDRATVVIDASGTVQYAASVTPAGERDIGELLGVCQKINADYSGKVEKTKEPTDVPRSSTLYIKDRCGFSAAALLARDNLHLQEYVTLKNISRDAHAGEELTKIIGKNQTPCLLVDNKPTLDSTAIVEYFASHRAPLP